MGSSFARCPETSICYLPSPPIFPRYGSCQFYTTAQQVQLNQTEVNYAQACFSSPLKTGVNLVSCIQVVLSCPKLNHSKNEAGTATLPCLTRLGPNPHTAFLWSNPSGNHPEAGTEEVCSFSLLEMGQGYER